MTYTHFKYFFQFVKIDVSPILRVFKSSKLNDFSFIIFISLHSQNKILEVQAIQLPRGRVRCSQRGCYYTQFHCQCQVQMHILLLDLKIDIAREEVHFPEPENDADYELDSMPGNPILWLGDSAFPETIESCALGPFHLTTP